MKCVMKVTDRQNLSHLVVENIGEHINSSKERLPGNRGERQPGNRGQHQHMMARRCTSSWGAGAKPEDP